MCGLEIVAQVGRAWSLGWPGSREGEQRLSTAESSKGNARSGSANMDGQGGVELSSSLFLPLKLCLGLGLG